MSCLNQDLQDFEDLQDYVVDGGLSECTSHESTSSARVASQ